MTKPVKQRVNMLATLNQFASYVKSFYGPGGVYADYFGYGATDTEIGVAIGIYLNRLRHEPAMTWGGGDSVDRERVRDIMLAIRE